MKGSNYMFCSFFAEVQRALQSARNNNLRSTRSSGIPAAAMVSPNSSKMRHILSSFLLLGLLAANQQQVFATCSGTPTAGSAVSTAPGSTTATSFTLSLSGATAFTTGITYQWQSSPDNTTWTSVTGQTNATYTVSSGFTSTTYYRCIVGCSAGGSANSASCRVVYTSCWPINSAWTNPTLTQYGYTGSVQTYTVPTGVTSIVVDMAGAKGGGIPDYGVDGGKGGRTQGTITGLTPGSNLYVYVGHRGDSGNCCSGTYPQGGSNSGGGAVGGVGDYYDGGGGGGGATDIRTTSGSTTTALNSRLMVAAGGGGAGGYCAEAGGAGGGLTGSLGNMCGTYYSSYNGTQGTQTAGGSAAGSGTAGGLGYGGNADPYNYGGGGGAGYYGAGGALYGSACGGSSYYGGTGVTGGSTTAGYQQGDGYVKIVSAAPNNPTYGINSFNINGGSGTSLSDASIVAAIPTSATGYLFRNSGSAVTLWQGNSFAASITFQTAVTYQEARVWIDFNDDAIFQSSESVTGNIGYSAVTAPSSPTTFNIVIPSGAATGMHLMRIRGAQEDGVNGTRDGTTPMDPCAANSGSVYYANGDIIDYYVTITPPPTVVATPTSLAFGTVITSTTSASQIFSISGSSLLTGPLTVTAPSNFQVSLNGTTWSSSVSVSYSGGTLSATNIYVNFTPTAVTSYSGNVSITGGGIVTVNVAVSGSGGTACSGTPTSGTAAVTPTFGNAFTPFSVTLTGLSAGAGFTYQWQTAPDSTTWTNVTGATSLLYSFTGISANTYLRCKVTCPYGGTTYNSVGALAELNSCKPTASSWSTYYQTTYSYTGSSTSFTVPSGVSSIGIDVRGAQGGSGYGGNTGGGGGRIQGTLPVTGGSTVYVYVGGAGTNYNYTGANAVGGNSGGGVAGGSAGYYAGGGGSSSDIRIGGTALSNRMAVAGGGGGGGYWCASGQDKGGDAGGLSGFAGFSCNSATNTSYTGQGGTQTAGGAAATTGGTAGSLGAGGSAGYLYYGGAGGGGYYGGGGGYYGGGGGGSSYADPSITGLVNTPSYNYSGNGSIVIGYGGGALATTYGMNALTVTAVSGGNLSDAGIAAAANSTTGYLSRKVTGPTVTLAQGGAHAASLTWGTAVGYQEAQVWIDFNNDGTFSPSEEVSPVVGYSTTAPANPTVFNINIPATAPTGVHMMRLRAIQEQPGTYGLSTDLDPCAVNFGGANPVYSQGDVVDYNVTITAPPACSGTPSPGTASISPTSGNPTTYFSLLVSGASLVSGLTYQWQSSPDGTTWTNVSGATNNYYNFSGLSGTTYYRCGVSCGSNTAYTSAVTATFVLPTASCTPAPTYASYACTSYGMTIQSLSLTGVLSTSISDALACNSTGYQDRTSLSCKLYNYSSYNITVGTGSSYQEYMQVWLDFNSDGIFQTSETIGGNTTSFSTSGIVPITIPSTVAPGTYRMRIVTDYQYDGHQYPTMDPCMSGYNYGEGRDYSITILNHPPALIDTPSSLNFGTIATSTSSSAMTFNLVGLYLTPATGSMTVNASTNYNVSLNGTTWTSSVTPTYTSGTLSVTPIYVRFNGPATVGTYTGTATITGGGIATPGVVSLTGISATPCSGTPSAGTTVVSPGAGMSSTTFSLSLTGTSLGTGLTYQWYQGSSSTGPFTAITGATNPTYSVSGLSSAAYFYCYVYCTYSSSGSNSSVQPAYVYCTPGYYSTYYYYQMSGLNIPVSSGTLGTSLTDVGISGSYFVDHTSLTPMNMEVGGTYAGTMTYAGSYYYWNDAIWIDYNDNGVFETSENVTGGTFGTTTCCTSVSSDPFTITVPSTATLGTHRMRVRNVNSIGYSAPTPVDPCTGSSSTSYYYGLTADYRVTLVPQPSFTITPSAVTFGTVAVGLSAVQTFSVTAANLYGTGNITVTAPTSYTVSLDGATYATTVNIPFSTSTFSATPVYVKFSPTTATTVTSNVTLTGGGIITPRNISVTGTGSYPVMTASPASLSFGTVTSGTVSSVLNISLSGLYFNPTSGSLTVTYPSNFYSNSAASSSTYTIAFSGGSLTSATIPVYFKPTALATYSGYITVTGGGITPTDSIAVNGIGGSPCGGTPSAGTATITPTYGSGSTPFTLGLSGVSSVSGLTYQWQKTTDTTAAWTTISGATNLSYGFTGISANTWFKCVVTCPSYASATSAKAYADLNTCTPVVGSWSGYTSTTYTYAGGSYSTWTVPTGVSNIYLDMQGATGGNGYGGNGGNGGRVIATVPVTGGSSVYIYVGGAGTSYNYTGSVAVGGTTAGGSAGYYAGGGGGASDVRVGGTALSNRVAVAAGGGGGGYWCGGVQDKGGYGGGLTGFAGYECNSYTNTSYTGQGGTQTAGGASAGYGGSAGSSGTGGNAGYYYYGGAGGGGYYGGGGSYYGGGAGGSSWVTASGTVTLDTGNYNSAGNGVVVVSYNAATINTSYGANGFAVSGGGTSSFSDAGLAALASSTTGYLNRKTVVAPVTLYQGGTHSCTLTWGTATANQIAQVWIDFNNDGTFSPSEEVSAVSGYSATSTTNPLLFNINIPSSAAIGIHSMRVRAALEQPGTYALPTDMDPCLAQFGIANPIYSMGDAIDYYANIQAIPACSGTPTAGSAVISPTSGNPTTTFSLSLSGTSVASGLTYQWQSSPDNSTWTNISSATLSTYSFSGLTGNTYYRCKVSCGGSATYVAPSASVLATFVLPAASCTPAPSYAGYSCTSYGMVYYSMSLPGAASTSISDAASCNSTGYYNRTSLSCQLFQGSSYVVTVGTGSSYPMNNQYWIDFNSNGTFETSESVGYSSSAFYPTGTITINIPATAPLGTFRLRGVMDYGYSGHTSGSLDPCMSGYTYGEARDYSVTIIQPPTITATPTSISFGSQNITTYSSDNNITYNGSLLTPSSGSLTINAPTNFYIHSGGVYYSSIVTSYSGSSFSSLVVPIAFNPAAVGTYTGTVTINGGGLAAPVNVSVNGTGVLPACSGTPASGTTVVSPTFGAGATPVTLSLSGALAASGLTYQWYYSYDTVTWTSLGSGATTNVYSYTPTLTQTTFYRCQLTCTATSSSAYSANSYIVYQVCQPTLNSYGLATNTYNYTGATTTWTVPTAVTSINVDIAGGSGGSGDPGWSNSGGVGGRVTGTFPVTPGQVLTITAGQAGGNAVSGTNGAAGWPNGGGTYNQTSWEGGGGGGSSSILVGTTGTTYLVVAGGGGGGGGDCNLCDAGGAGGGLTGSNGTGGAGYPGSGGNTTSATGGSSTYSGGAGSFMTGGSGSNYLSGGGGGGGYYGGGGGYYSGGGGGGSSYTISTATSVVNGVIGGNSGNGYVKISYPANDTRYGINKFYIAGSGSSLADSNITTACNAQTGYLGRLFISPVTLNLGGVYGSSISWGRDSLVQEAQVWIDYNDDATFQTSEEVSAASGTTTPAVVGYSASATVDPTVFSIAIGQTATPGQHLMRVRGILEDGTYALSLSTDLDPCLNSFAGGSPKYKYGNAIDYKVNVKGIRADSGGVITSTSLTFPTTTTGTPSSALNLQLFGKYLDGTTPITITPPAGYDIYIGGVRYGSGAECTGGASYVINPGSGPYSGTTLALDTIPVCFDPVYAISYPGVLSISGGGVPTVYITLNGSGVNVCSGTPTAGFATASPIIGTSSTPIALSITGATAASGLTYQWKKSTDGTTYSTIAGATNPSWTTTTGVTTNVWFECVVTCGSNSATTVPAQFYYFPTTLACSPADTNWTATNSVTFPYLASNQIWTVPTGPGGYKTLNINAAGAKGGTGYNSSYGAAGGAGARIQGQFFVASSHILNIYTGGVGGNGTSSTGGVGGYNGGGNGAFFNTTQDGGGGGGGTTIYDNSTIMLEAGGGGGGGSYGTTNYGGTGGQNVTTGGASGNAGTSSISSVYAGSGGTPSSGGAASSSYYYHVPTAGTFGQGGYGTDGGGGGGGGYYGGGGSSYGAGAGGGSSYVNSSYLIGTGIYNATTNAGAGTVSISYPYENPAYGVNNFTINSLMSDGGLVAASNNYTGYSGRLLSVTPVTLFSNATTGTTSYPSSVTFSNTVATNYQEAAVWIDFNNNGTFETSEQVSCPSGTTSTSCVGYTTGTTASPVPFDIVIPPAVSTGLRLMRVRGVYEDAGYTRAATTYLAPCASNYGGTYYYSGTTADYLVNISRPTPIINVTPSSLNFGVGTVVSGTISAAQSFTITASYLTAPIVITPPYGYDLNIGGTRYTYGSSYTYPSAGYSATISGLSIPVEFVPTGASLASYPGAVSITSTGAATAYVSVSGTSAAQCSGTPSGGTASATPTTGAGSTSFTLTATGSTTGGGTMYQWYSSTDSVNYTPIAGATNTTYTFTGIATTMYYKMKDTCPYTGNVAYSSRVTVSYIAPSSCSPSATSWASESGNVQDGIDAFYINVPGGPLNLSSTGIVAAAGTTTGYLDRTNVTTYPPITLYNGAAFATSVTWGSGASSTTREFQVWIDFNDDGYFAPGEEVTGVIGFGTSCGGGSTSTTNITIPNSANPGTHKMRIRAIKRADAVASASSDLDPCAQYYYSTPTKTYNSGDEVDYQVIIARPTITLGPNPAACVAASSSTVAQTYLATTGAPNQYNLYWGSIAAAAGFTNVTGWAGTISGTSGSFNITVPGSIAAGSYTGTLTVKNSTNGDTSSTYTVTLNLNASPSFVSGTASTSPSTSSLCSGATVSLSAVTTGGSGTATYTWSGPGLTSYTGSTTTIPYSGTVTPTVSVASLASGVYSVAVSYSGVNCASIAAHAVGGTYSVAPTGTPTLTVTSPATLGMCSGTSATLNAATVANPYGTPVYSWSGPAMTTATSSTSPYSFTTSTSSTVSGTYSVGITYASTLGCNKSATTAGVYTVAPATATPTLTVTSPSSSTLCAGTAVSMNVAVSGGGSFVPSYSWSGPAVTTTTSTATSINLTTSTVSSVSGVYSVAVVYTVASGCNKSATSAATYTVTPTISTPTVTVTAPSFTNICSGTAVTLNAATTGGSGTPTYTWSGPGVTSFTTATASASFTPTVSTSTTGAYSVTVSYSGVGCTTVSGTSPSFTIAPQPSVTAASSLTTLCTGGSVTLTATPTGGVGTAVYTWTGPGIASTTTGSTAVAVTPTVATTTSGYYSVTLTYTGASGCTAATNHTASIVTVNVAPTVTLAASTTSLCTSGTLTLTATPAGGSGTATYTWTGPGITSSTSSTASVTKTPTVSTTTSGAYSVSLSYSGAGCAAVSNTSAVVTVNTQPTVSISASPTTLCTGGSETLSASGTGGAGTATYTWTGPGISSTTGSTATPAAFTPTVSTTTAAAYSVSVSYSGSGCTTATNSSSIVTVASQPTVTATPSLTTLCSGGSESLSASISGGTGLPTFTWTGPGIATTTASSSPAVVTPTVSTTTTGAYSVTVSLSGAGCNSASATTSSVTVNQQPTVSAVASATALCTSGSLTLTATPTGGSGTPTYTWSGPGIVTTTSSSTTVVVTPTVSTTTSGAYSVTVGFSGTGCSTASGATAVVTVNTQPTVSISASPSTLCTGGSETLTASGTGGAGTATYTWTGPGISSTTGSTATPAAFTPTVSTTTAAAYSVSVSYSGSGCTTASNSSTVVTVASQPTVTATATASSLCSGGSETLNASILGGTGLPSFSWTGPGISTLVGSSSSVATTPTVSSTTTGAYSVTLTLGGAGCNTATATTSVVTVNQLPVVTLGTSSSNICTGGNETLTATVTGGSGTPTYTWSGIGISSTTGTSNVQVFTPTVSTTSSGTYSVAVGFSGSGCGSSSATSAPVTVNLQPAVSMTASTLNLCTGSTETLAAVPTGGAGTATYTWSGPGISTTTGSTASPAAFTVSVGSLTTAAYSVTLSYSGAGCISATATTSPVTVNVLPTAVTIGASPAAMCVGTSLSLTSSATGATSYSWSGPNSFVASVANPASFTTSALSAGVYSLTVYSGACSVNTVTPSVVVDNMPSLGSIAPNNAALCLGSLAVVLGETGAPVNPTTGTNVYTWSGPLGVVGTTATLTAATSVSFTPSTIAATGTYTLSAAYGEAGCTSAPVTANLVVDTVPSLGAVNVQYLHLCGGVLDSVTETGTVKNPSTGSNVYTWAGAGGFTTTFSSYYTGSNFTFVPVNPANTGIYTLSAVYSEAGCASNQITSALVTVDSPSVVTLSASNTGAVCSGVLEVLSATATGGTGTRTFTWSGPGIATPTSTGSVGSYSVYPLGAGGAYTLTVSYPVFVPGCNVMTTTPVVTPTPQSWLSSSVDNNWNNAANWSCGTVPVATDTVLIPGVYAHQPTIFTGGSGTVGNINLAAGSSIYLADASSTLHLKGAISGTGAVSGPGTAMLDGSSSQLIHGSALLQNVTVNNPLGVSMATATDTLNVNGTLRLASGVFNTGNSLVFIMQDSSLATTTGRLDTMVAGGGYLNGKAIIQQTIQAFRAWRFLAHPFADSIPLSQLEYTMDISGSYGAAHGFTSTVGNNPSAYFYHTTVANTSITTGTGDPGWKPFTWAKDSVGVGGIHVSGDSNEFKRFEGIRIMVRGAKGQGLDSTSGYYITPCTVRMWGRIDTGAFDVRLQKGGAFTNPAAPNWLQDYNLVGNPYPSAIDLGKVVNNAYNNGMLNTGYLYVWYPYGGAAGIYEAIDESTYTQYVLPANAAFMVRAKNGHDSSRLHFYEGVKTTGATYKVLKNSSDILALNIYDANYHIWDFLNIKFNETATDADDMTFDGGKPVNPGLNFYSLSSDRHPLSNDARPFKEGSVIPLGIASDYQQEFIIRADQMKAPAGAQVYLHDKLLEKYVLLAQGTEYRFSITKDAATQGENRFELGMVNGGAVNFNGATGDLRVAMIPNPASSTVTVSFAAPEKANTAIRILSVEGVCVMTHDLGAQQSGSVTLPIHDLASGIYMVELTSGNNKVVQRLVKE
jgi:Glycine rich protein/GEVED domain/Secretion system C-terminal sorting domain